MQKKAWLGLAIGVALADQGAKHWIAGTFPLGAGETVLPFFNLVHILNSGAAFSFLANAGGWQRYVFIALALVVSVGLTELLPAPFGPMMARISCWRTLKEISVSAFTPPKRSEIFCRSRMRSARTEKLLPVEPSVAPKGPGLLTLRPRCRVATSMRKITVWTSFSSIPVRQPGPRRRRRWRKPISMAAEIQTKIGGECPDLVLMDVQMPVWLSSLKVWRR